ncbi:MAG: type IIL restriction-modification enzyme MmeI [Gemmataceae bacterium]
MTPQDFIAKWSRAQLSERSAAQQHFLDLCDLLGQEKPAAADPDGSYYTFEKGVQKTGGGKGWADVWRRGHFAWEYKGRHRDLVEAYSQLNRYREDLENPPLLIVCDLDRFEIHTNFTNTPKVVHGFDLSGLAEPKNLDILRKVFTDPESLKPGQTVEQITEEVAELFSKLADGMRARNIPAQQAAHFLMKLMFCMFAEDVGLFDAPGMAASSKLFSKLLNTSRFDPPALTRRLRGLFKEMAAGGEFGADPIRYFNGGLFTQDDDVVDLTNEEIDQLIDVNKCDWSNVEPSIFGTLFERTLDPAKRSQIGAHYTSREDILTLLEPVLMTPLRREWEAVRARCDVQWSKVQEAVRNLEKAASTRARKEFDKLLEDFLGRLAHTKILDPACGSGNFLYVAINLLLDLENQVIAYGSPRGFSRFPHVRPTQLLGIEINPYAQQLAQVVIWIGYLQWMHHNGYIAPSDPVLEPFENIKLMDAIIDLSDPEQAKEPDWPEAEFIVGNPPFLGDKKMRGELGDDYVHAVRKLYDGRLPSQSELCCYWFEKARAKIAAGEVKRAGLLATQGIRGGANRVCLERIKASGDIFWAWSDRDWILDGAVVHVSMVGFDRGEEKTRILNGGAVDSIHANLVSGSRADVTKARPLQENANLCFLGVMKAGPFDIVEEFALELLRLPNPNGLPNSNVLRPRLTARDILQRSEVSWIVDFGTDMSAEQASLYEKPWEYVEEYVEPSRRENRRSRLAKKWWLHGEPRPGLRAALTGLSRFIVTPEVSKHRIFVWLDSAFLADHQTRAFASDQDYFFGVLHSRVHEIWARGQGTQLRERESGFRYTPTTCFETFPLPQPTEEQKAAIAHAARELDRLRNAWLNPPEWTRQEVLEFPGAVDGAWRAFVTNPDLHGIGTVRYPRLVPKDDDCAAELEKRTLTNLYNERPTWLDLAHQRLDAAVATAYGWDLSDQEILERLLALNLNRASAD